MPTFPEPARIGAAILAAALAACTTTSPNQRDDAARAQFEQYAGPPIGSFTYLGRYYGWRSLGRDTLVIWTTVNDAYLITVLDPCIKLPFANGIGLTSTAHTVDRNFDWVLLGRAPSTLDRCHIDTIRKVDYLRMKRELHAGPAGPP